MVVQQKRIGFIGIGTMGKPMSLNLIKAGYPLIAYDLNLKPLGELRAKGAAIGQSIKEVAGQSDIIITMLPKSEDVEEVMLGDQGVIGGVKSSSIIIDMSTIDASVSRNIAQAFLAKNIKMLDAPVIGGLLASRSRNSLHHGWRGRKDLSRMSGYFQGHGEEHFLLRSQWQRRSC